MIFKILMTYQISCYFGIHNRKFFLNSEKSFQTEQDINFISNRKLSLIYIKKRYLKIGFINMYFDISYLLENTYKNIINVWN